MCAFSCLGLRVQYFDNCLLVFLTQKNFFAQILLFATSNDSEKILPEFQEAAKSFKGKVIQNLKL